jgi:hypothetical protein
MLLKLGDQHIVHDGHQNKSGSLYQMMQSPGGSGAKESAGLFEGFMSDAFDSDATNLMSSALAQALSRLKMLGLVDGDAEAASATLGKLILQAAEAGERNVESLVLYAIGRFQADNAARE